MKRVKRLLSVTHILFLAALFIQFMPSHTKKIGDPKYSAGLLLILEIAYIILILLRRKQDRIKTTNGVFGVIFSFIGIWTLLTAKFVLILQDIFKAPDVVTEQFVSDLPRLMNDLAVSMITITTGYILALITAIPIGLDKGRI